MLITLSTTKRRQQWAMHDNYIFGTVQPNGSKLKVHIAGYCLNKNRVRKAQLAVDNEVIEKMNLSFWQKKR
jgi:hypothetical protein